MIEAVGIDKLFGTHQVLRNASMRCERGKTNLVIGKSGSGKTVLLKIIAGLLEPDGGQIRFEGQDLRTLSPGARRALQRQIGMIFQGGALFDSMRVEENVTFPIRMHTHVSIREARRMAQESLERVDLPNVGRLYPSDLSGGMRKRVAIARAIAMRPMYLLCDEPNSGLDPQTSLVIDSLIHEITQEYNITTIVNTHDMNSVMAIGDTVTFIHEGSVAWSGTKDDILHTQNELLNGFVFATPMAQLLRQQTGKH